MIKIICIILLLLISGCAWEADSIGIGGTYLNTSIHGQNISEVMPIIIVNFKPVKAKEKYK